MKLKIKVTKEIIQASHMCGTKGNEQEVTKNCAIALAIRNIFPLALVGPFTIQPDYKINACIELPLEAKLFIHKFDDLLRETNPKGRLDLEPIEFEIELPESVIQQINIDDIIKSQTLELVK